MDIFNIVFGTSTVPGSVDVFDKLLELEDRHKVAKFCDRIRCYAAGGVDSQKNLECRLSVLERQGRQSFFAGRFDDAYSFFEEFGHLRGEYSADLFLLVIQSLMANGRYEESAALAFVASNYFAQDAPAFDAPLHQSYHHLGYDYLTRNILNDIAFDKQVQKWDLCGFPTCSRKSFTNQDLASTFEKLLSFSEPAKWNVNLFLLIHALVHADVCRGVIVTPANFAARFGCNKIFMDLINRAAIDNVTHDEMRFIVWFLKFVKRLSLEEQFFNEAWFRSFIKRFSDSLITKRGLAKLASSSAGFCRLALSGLTGFTRSILNDSFQWYCYTIVLFIFTGDKLDFMTPYGACEMGAAAPVKITNLQDEDMSIAIDLFALYCQINFAEWNFTCLKGEPDYNMIIYAPRTLGESLAAISKHLIELTKTCSSRLSTSSIFLHVGIKFAYLASKYDTLNERGMALLRDVVDILTCTETGSRAAVEILAQWRPFTDRLSAALTKCGCSIHAARLESDKGILKGVDEFKKHNIVMVS